MRAFTYSRSCPIFLRTKERRKHTEQVVLLRINIRHHTEDCITLYGRPG